MKIRKKRVGFLVGATLCVATQTWPAQAPQALADQAAAPTTEPTAVPSPTPEAQALAGQAMPVAPAQEAPTVTQPTPPATEVTAPTSPPIPEQAAPVEGTLQAGPEPEVAPEQVEMPGASPALAPETSEQVSPAATTPAEPAQMAPSAMPTPPPGVPTEEPAQPSAPAAQPAQQMPAASGQKPAKPEALAEGITTLDLEEGNWFLKRQALEKTMNVIEALNTLFTKVLDLRMTFLVKRNKIDRDFDLFAKQTGFELGDINQMITSLIEQMEKERKREGQLDDKEREFLTQMEQKLEELKKLQIDVGSITDMDASIDDVLMQVEQEIDQSHQYQMQGWRNFQSIKKVLNDEKAEELYLKTEGLLNNMKDIYSYLNGQLLSYFNKTVQTLQDTMAAAKGKLDALKAQGADLKQTVENFVKSDEQKDKEREAAEEKRRLEEAQRKAVELEKKQHVSFGTQLMGYITAPFVWLWNLIAGLFGIK